MNFQSAISSRRSAELQQAEEEAWYAYLDAEIAAERAEARYKRAVSKFLTADEQLLEAVAAVIGKQSSPELAWIISELSEARKRSVVSVDTKRPAWVDAASRFEQARKIWKDAYLAARSGIPPKPQ